MRPPAPDTPSYRPRGFTLIELAVVLAIIATLLTLGVSALRDVKGNGLSAGVTSVGQLFESARSLAVSRGKQTRVLVSRSSEPDRFLREFAVAVLDIDDEGDEFWRLSGNPVVLPTGIYLDEAASICQVGEVVTDREPGGQQHLYYSFSPVGTSEHPGARVVLAVGVSDPEGPSVFIPNSKQRHGFVVRRLGRITFFRSPEQIDAPTPDQP